MGPKKTQKKKTSIQFTYAWLSQNDHLLINPPPPYNGYAITPVWGRTLFLTSLNYYKKAWSETGPRANWRFGRGRTRGPDVYFLFLVFKKSPATIGGPHITIRVFYFVEVAQTVAWYIQNRENQNVYFYFF